MNTHRVGLISDTHGLLRPEAVQALQGTDLIIHAGDIGKVQVLRGLQAVSSVKAVRGNVDTAGWARRLPKSAAFEIDQAAVYTLHDIAELDIVPEAAGVRVVISGHTHAPSIQARNGVLYVNPGSAGPRRFHLPVSIAIMYVQGRSVDAELVTLDT